MKYWNLNFSEEIVPVTNKAWVTAVRTYPRVDKV